MGTHPGDYDYDDFGDDYDDFGDDYDDDTCRGIDDNDYIGLPTARGKAGVACINTGTASLGEQDYTHHHNHHNHHHHHHHHHHHNQHCNYNLFLLVLNRKVKSRIRC